MAVLPFEPTPFFSDKNRAFWTLQIAGWGGAFLLRAITSLVSGQDVNFIINLAIEGITGFSISLILSVVYHRVISDKPLIVWTSMLLALIVGVGIFTFVVSLVVWLILKLIMGIRVSEEDEIAGLDMSELGMEAYPEFSKG